MSGTGSTGKIVEGIANVLLDKGHTVKIAYGYGSSTHPNAVCFGQHRAQYIHKVMSHMFDMQGLWSKADTRRLINIIKDFKPDVINLHNLHGNYLNYPLFFKFLKSYDAKVVWTLHDCWSFTGHCPHFVFCGCDKWKTECHHCPQLSMYPASDFWDGSKRNHRLKKENFTGFGNKMTIVAVSEWLANLVRQSFWKTTQIQVIHNGIDLDLFQPASTSDIESARLKYNLGEDKVILAVAAPWSKRKGFDDLMKLSELLPKGYKLMMVGLNEEQLRNLPDNIIGIRRTENAKELAILYSVASVFVNTTYEDCFPTVNLEALGCGTPVITYRTGGSPEAIDELTGVVINQGDINGLKQAIESIATSSGSINQKCRQRALDNFTASMAFTRYSELFEQLTTDNK